MSTYLEILAHVNVFFVFMYLGLSRQSSLQACGTTSIIHPGRWLTGPSLNRSIVKSGAWSKDELSIEHVSEQLYFVKKIYVSFFFFFSKSSNTYPTC